MQRHWLLIFSIFLNLSLSAGVPIDIDPKGYEKLLTDIDAKLQKLPPEWETYKVENGKLILASGAAIDVALIKKMAQMSADELIDFVESSGVVVKVLCSKRDNFVQSIKSHKCVGPEAFPSDFHKEPFNAQYLSKFSTLTKDNTPMMFLRQDTPRYSIVHEFIHHFQETAAPAHYKDYRFKSLRVALGDSMFEKGDKRTDLDKLVFQQLRLVQWLLDEVENYSAMLKYHSLFELSFTDSHELFWKLGNYLSRCGNKRCKAELAKADAFFKDLQATEIKRRVSTLQELKISDQIVRDSLAKAPTFKTYDLWFKSLKEKLYASNNLDDERKKAVALWEEVNKPSFPYKKKEETFNLVLSWMAKNTLLQLQALKVAADLQNSNKGLRHFQTQIAADIKYFSSYVE